MTQTAVKICGLKTREALLSAIDAGADFIGFNFYPPSPRFIESKEAQALTRLLPPSVKAVGLFVNPEDAALDETLKNVKLDIIQLHGDETPQRVTEIKTRTGLPVMKALRIKSAQDLLKIPVYETASDRLLLDAWTQDSYGGTGQSFDWKLLTGYTFQKPWMLAGGLTPDNVARAIQTLQPDAVDVSSGVESAPGVKDPAKIRAFIQNAKRKN